MCIKYYTLIEWHFLLSPFFYVAQWSRLQHRWTALCDSEKGYRQNTWMEYGMRTRFHNLRQEDLPVLVALPFKERRFTCKQYFEWCDSVHQRWIIFKLNIFSISSCIYNFYFVFKNISIQLALKFAAIVMLSVSLRLTVISTKCAKRLKDRWDNNKPHMDEYNRHLANATSIAIWITIFYCCENTDTNIW